VWETSQRSSSQLRGFVAMISFIFGLICLKYGIHILSLVPQYAVGYVAVALGILNVVNAGFQWRQSKQFTLRNAFIAMTIVAVSLGLMACL
jgi:hypothetical protein